MQRNTRQKGAVKAALTHADRPLTPQEILEGAQLAVPGLGIATVYRVLKGLLEEGEATVVSLPGQAPRYEMAHLGHHHHFQCRACDKVFEVSGCPGDLTRLAPAGFELEGHEVVLYGRCSTCVADVAERSS